MRLTRLNSYDADEVLDIFMKHSTEGSITRVQFYDVLLQLRFARGNVPLQDRNHFGQVCSYVFDLFDVNDDYTIDIQELLCGLSALFGGSKKPLKMPTEAM